MTTRTATQDVKQETVETTVTPEVTQEAPAQVPQALVFPYLVYTIDREEPTIVHDQRSPAQVLADFEASEAKRGKAKGKFVMGTGFFLTEDVRAIALDVRPPEVDEDEEGDEEEEEGDGEEALKNLRELPPSGGFKTL